MKSCQLILCTLLLCAGLKGQPKSDTPLIAATPEKDDTAFINLLNKKSVDIYLYNPDSARVTAEKALILSMQSKYTRGKGMSFAAIGYSYWAQSHFYLSLYYLVNALKYLKTTNAYAELSMCNRIIARNYIEMGKYGQAASYLKDAKVDATLSRDNFKIELVYNEASLLDTRQKKYPEAWAKCTEGLALCFKNKDTLLTGIMYGRMANILKQTNKIIPLKNYYDTAYQWSIYAKNNRLRALVLNHYAEYYIITGRIDSSLNMAIAASRLSDSIGNMELKLMSTDIMVRAYRTEKNVAKELEYSRIYNKLQDSARQVESNNDFQLLQQFFAINNKLHNIEEAEEGNTIGKERLQFQHVIIIALIVFIAILIAGIFTIYYFYNEKKRLADQLIERNSSITEQKNIIEEQSRHLAELNDLKTKLFAIISHDLRTPISSLRSIMALFQQRDLSEEQAVSLLKRMLPALDGADLTLSNLLNWSVKQMNGLKVNKTSVSVLQMAEEIQKVFESSLQEKNIHLDIDVNAETKIYFDEHHLKIIMRNLVSNAIKFTPQNGKITIGDGDAPGKTTIYVRDTGNGISEADLPKLFAPTVYFTTRGTGGEKGTGLGLVLCKELVDLNGGAIYVESTLGKGSCFYVEAS
jgi:signal transduction histidine kinase